MKTVFVLAGLVVVRAAYGYFGLGLVMRPDFGLYSQGGLGLFPSPLGRLAGAFGAVPLVVLSIAGAGVCVLAVGLAARRRALGGGRWAAFVFVCSPASLYLAYAGVDAIGLALLLLAFAGVLTGWLLPASALVHLSLVPFALLSLPRSLAARTALAVVGGCAVASLLLTPYGSIVTGLLDRRALESIGAGLLAGVLVSFPAFLFWTAPAGSAPSTVLDADGRRVPAPLEDGGSRWRVPGPWLVALLIGAGECGLQHHLQARYLLPAGAVAAVYARAPALTALRRVLSPLTALLGSCWHLTPARCRPMPWARSLPMIVRAGAPATRRLRVDREGSSQNAERGPLLATPAPVTVDRVVCGRVLLRS